MKCSNKLIYLGITSALSVPVLAGDLEPSSGPADASSGMHTLEDIYNRLDGIEAPTPTGFTEPTSGPGSTGRTLTEVYNKVDTVMNNMPSDCTPNSNASPVFTDNGNGTVTDNRTCLIWLQNANCANARRNWATAETDVAQLNTDGTMNGNDCGDTSNSNSHQTDWRLPTVQELQSLVHYGYTGPAMSNAAGTEKWNTGTPGDDAFSGVQAYRYWSSTPYASGATYAWYVYLFYGHVYLGSRTSSFYVWPVRGGQ